MTMVFFTCPRTPRHANPACLFGYVLSAILLLLLQTPLKAQNCTTPVQNNNFVIKPAVCSGTVAFLQGSAPTGGNGNYTYRWEMSLNNCSDNNFFPIPGATNKDFHVPAIADDEICYRRVVISGGCTSVSNKTKVKGPDRTNPASPVVTTVQPTCSSGGSITITNPAPSTGFSYSINGNNYSNTSGVFQNLSPGTYQVTARHVTGCTSPVRTVTLNTPTAASGTVSPSSASICAGQTQVLTASGGNSYRWYRNGSLIAGATANTYSASQAGTYRADIVNGSCTATSNNCIITVTPSPTGSIAPSAATICPGDSVNLSTSGGASYQWFKDGSPISGATSSMFRAKQSGTYSVDIISSNGCKAKAGNNAVVTVSSPSSAAISPATAIICSGGSVTLTASGGSGYQWYRNGAAINGATAGTYHATQAGTYTVDIITSAGCSGTASNSAVVTVGSSPTGTISPASGQLCGSNASVVLTVTGGSSYQWYRNNTLINGATSSTFTATTAGTYTADIISGSCTGKASNSVVISQGNGPNGNITPAVATICPGSSQLLTASGGTSYQWMKDGTAIAGATSPTYTATQPGTYTVTIFNGTCSAPAANAASVSLSEPPAGTISPANATICSGTSQVLTATGGVSYQWYRNNTAISGATVATYTATQSGTYSVDVTGSNGCKAKALNDAVVNVTQLPSGTISPSSGVLCGNGALTLSVTGGNSYQWYKDGVAINGAVNNTYMVTTAGTYTVQIRNGNCTAQATNSAVITQANAPVSTISPSVATICTGSSQLLTATGGTSYQWFRNNVLIAGATGNTLMATQAGVYSVTAINGMCSSTSSNVATITEASAPTGSISPASVTICSGGSQVLTATGGNSYQWYRNGIAINGATSATYTAASDGLYSVDLISSNGCKAKATNESLVTISPAPAGSISPASGSICTNGSLVLTASGGVSYQWYKDGSPLAGATGATYVANAIGTYTADVINAHGCKTRAANSAVITHGAAPTGSVSPASATICPGSGATLTATGGSSYQWFLNGNAINGATAATFQATQTGTYSVTIFNGSCSGPAGNVSVVTAGTPLSFSVSATQPTCAKPTGTITVTNAAGGSGSGYLYSKDNGTSYQASSLFADLPAGTYQIVVKDAAGCKSTATAVVINPSTSTLQASVSTTSISCTQTSGTATITASGGTTPYQYSLNGGAMQNGNVFSNLSAGAHKIMVKDGAGCSVEVSFQIQSSNSTLSATATTTHPGCGQSTGSVQITATGGAPGYSYSLDNGSFQTGNTFSNLSVGTHKVRVKDQAGCLFDVTFEIRQTGSNPSLIITAPSATCSTTTVDLRLPAVTIGSDTGLVLSYWQDSNATNALANPGAVAAGTYYIKATNAAGCFTIKPVTIKQGTSTNGSIAINGPTAPCHGQSVTLKASRGQGYQWYRNDTLIVGATAESYTANTSGLYSVLIDDGTCKYFASNSVRLRFQDCAVTIDPKVFVPTAFTPNRNGANDVLRPILYQIAELEYFRVYNRWGQLVFQTSKMGDGWNGMLHGLLQPTETYSWILACKDKNGNVIKQSGKTVLIR